MSARITSRWLAVWFLLGLAVLAPAAERAYWVWQRSEPLTEPETAELHRQGVGTLYWQVATLNEVGVASAGVRDLAAVAPGLHVVPVVRLELPKLPERAVFLKLARFALEGALQLDFDVPDSRLGEYAARLAELRTKVPHLSITALAHWPEVKDFPALARSVEELCPMFYDLQNDPTGVSADAPPPPILDSAPADKWLAKWKGCPTRWRAGLPTFSRVTVFDETGLSRGQIPAWEWDEIAFNFHLRTVTPTRAGVTLLRADAPITVARRAIHEGELLAVRTTDRDALAACADAVEKSGAAGVIYYRLPAKGSDATCSLRSLGTGEQARPQFVLKRDGDALVLLNEGAADLAPHLFGKRGDRDRGYTLEIDAPAPLFREAEPGAFFRVMGHTDPESKAPLRASVNLATRLTFWFSHLDAGASLRSGLFQLAPAAAAGSLRWRVAGGDWQPLHIP